MDADTYKNFVQALLENLRRDERVLGLAAVGSMARTVNPPDEWSDHDFLAVTAPGAEEEFRTSTDWLPSYRPIVLHFQETAHGVKVVYDDGHLLEYAIFNMDDFRLAKINSYRVLIDRGGFKELVESAAEETKASSLRDNKSDEHLIGQFLTHLLVGASRHARGEKLSGMQFVKQFALDDLLRLLTPNIAIESVQVLDNIEPTRRFERAFPRLGAALNSALSMETPEAALALMDLASRNLPGLIAAENSAVRVIQKRIQAAAAVEWSTS